MKKVENSNYPMKKLENSNYTSFSSFFFFLFEASTVIFFHFREELLAKTIHSQTPTSAYILWLKLNLDVLVVIYPCLLYKAKEAWPSLPLTLCFLPHDL